MKKQIAIAISVLLIFTVFLGCQSQPENSTGPSPSNLPVTPVPSPPNASPSPLNPDLWNLDYATIKYDSRGNELWVARYNGPGNNIDEARALAVDNAGNVYVTGGSRSDRGNGIREDYATVKYDANGNQLWVARYGGPGDGDNMAEALAVDAEGNVYITGQSQGKNGDWDYATVKYNNRGNELWTSRYNGPGSGLDRATSLVVGSEGNVYVTGSSGGIAGIPITIQSPWPDVPVYTDVTQAIKTRTGGEIAFGFETGTRLGLGWDGTHDENMVSLMDRELVMDQTGISGTTWFLFKALEPGETRITFIYSHGGTERANDIKEFRVEIEE